MQDRKYFLKIWIKKVTKWHQAKEIVSEYISENEYNKVMEQLLTELLDFAIKDDESKPTPISKEDKVFYDYKDSIKYFGVEDNDIVTILNDVAKTIE